MSAKRIGLIGYGRIGRTLADRIDEMDGLELTFVCRADPTSGGESDRTVVSPDDAPLDERVDLVVEAATFRAVEETVPAALEASDILVLSTAALADRDLLDGLEERCRTHGTNLFVPHGAVLGTDGLRDASEALDEVRTETRKHPDNLDFSYAEDIGPGDVDGETELYDGPTRAICGQFPRNVNSHATVALAGIGFDDTRSTLIADPTVTTATHHIVAAGDGTTLAVERETEIEGVTGEYTLASIWGTVRRILSDEWGVAVV